MLTAQSLQLDGKHRFCQVTTTYPVAGLTNLWLPCREWHAAFTAVPVVVYSFAPPASLYCEEHVCIYIHTHISDCLDIVYELPLLPKYTASETLLHK